MRRLTAIELEQVRQRANNTTEGPWRIGRQSPNGLNNVGTMGGILTAQTTEELNAEFIANARQDIPQLLNEVETLISEKARAREKVDTLLGVLLAYDVNARTIDTEALVKALDNIREALLDHGE